MNSYNLGVKLRALLKTKIRKMCFENIKIPTLGPSAHTAVVSRG